MAASKKMRPLDHLSLIRRFGEERQESIDEDLHGLLSQVCRKLGAVRSLPEVLDIYFELLCNVFYVFAYNHMDGVRSDDDVQKYQTYLCDLVDDVVEYAGHNLPAGFAVEAWRHDVRDALRRQASDWGSEAINRADGIKRGILEAESPPAVQNVRPVPSHRFRGRDPLFRDVTADDPPSIHVKEVRDDLLGKLRKHCSIWDQPNPNSLLSPDLMRGLLSSVRLPHDNPPAPAASPSAEQNIEGTTSEAPPVLTEADPIAAERSAMMADFRSRAKRCGITVTDALVAQAANPKWTERTPVGRWKRNDPRCTRQDDRMIRALLSKDPSSIWPRLVRTRSPK